MTLKQHVQGNVKFLHFKNVEGKPAELWYKCEDGFEFPIPFSDTEGAIFGAEDKAMYFMRWIRSHMMLIASAQIEKETNVST